MRSWNGWLLIIATKKSIALSIKVDKYEDCLRTILPPPAIQLAPYQPGASPDFFSPALNYWLIMALPITAPFLPGATPQPPTKKQSSRKFLPLPLNRFNVQGAGVFLILEKMFSLRPLPSRPRVAKGCKYQGTFSIGALLFHLRECWWLWECENARGEETLRGSFVDSLVISTGGGGNACTARKWFSFLIQIMFNLGSHCNQENTLVSW